MGGRETHVPVSAKELMSSRSSQHAMNFWPRPMVYLPLGTLSNSSSSSSEMHCGMIRTRDRICKRESTYAAGEVHLHGKDTDILGAGRRLDVLAGGGVLGDGHGSVEGGVLSKDGMWRRGGAGWRGRGARDVI